MEHLLKGNYKINAKKSTIVQNDDSLNDIETVKKFEKSAREKLGGSIAFIMKNNQFVWDVEKT